jgi:hypothetical protein
MEQKEKEGEECPVCLESLARSHQIKLGCGHVFCKKCLLKIIETAPKRRSCPLCRAPFSVSVVQKDSVSVVQKDSVLIQECLENEWRLTHPKWASQLTDADVAFIIEEKKTAWLLTHKSVFRRVPDDVLLTVVNHQGNGWLLAHESVLRRVPDNVLLTVVQGNKWLLSHESVRRLLQ